MSLTPEQVKNAKAFGIETLDKLKAEGSVVEYAMIGSAVYVDAPRDVDFAVLTTESCVHVFEDLQNEPTWHVCGREYETVEVWTALRNGPVNFMITHDAEFYARYVLAMKVAQGLKLQDRRDRIIACQIIRDGRSPEEARARQYPFEKREVVNALPIEDGSDL